jgi:hypothetical protein
MYFPWLSAEAELAIFNVTFYAKIIFEKELMKTKKKLPSMENLKLSTNVLS